MSAANLDIPSVFSSSTTTSSTAASSATLANPDGRGVVVAVNVSVESAGTFTVTIQGIINGVAYTILTSAALGGATGVTLLRVYPGLTASANVTASDVLPRQWRVTFTPTGFTGVVNVAACVVV